MHPPNEVGQIATGGGGLARLDFLEGICQLGIQAGLQGLFEMEAVDHVDHDRQAIGCRHLKGPGIAGGPLRSCYPTLVGGWATAAYRDMVHRRAIRFQGNGLGGTAIVLQTSGIKLGIGVLQGGACCKVTGGIVREVVALIRTKSTSAVAACVVGYDAPSDAHRAEVAETAAAASRVVRDGAVCDGHRSAVEAAGVASSRVVRDGAVADSHRSAQEAAAVAATEDVADGRVVIEGAVADDGHRSADEAAAVVGRVVSEGAVGDGHLAGAAVEAAAVARGHRVVGEGAVADVHRADGVVKAAAKVAGRVVGEGAVADAHRAVVGEAAAGDGRVVSEGAVGDGQRATGVAIEAAAEVGRVVGEGAIGDGHLAVVDNKEATATAAGEAIGNGEGVEGEGDAGIHKEDPHCMLAVEGDLLPLTV